MGKPIGKRAHERIKKTIFSRNRLGEDAISDVIFGELPMGVPMGTGYLFLFALQLVTYGAPHGYGHPMLLKPSLWASPWLWAKEAQ